MARAARSPAKPMAIPRVGSARHRGCRGGSPPGTPVCAPAGNSRSMSGRSMGAILLVEEPHFARWPAGDEAQPLTQAAGQFRLHAAPDEVEARTYRLFEYPGNAAVRLRVEDVRLPERREHAILVEAERRLSAVSSGVVVGRTLTRVKRFTERFDPQRLRRPTSKNPRAAARAVPSRDRRPRPGAGSARLRRRRRSQSTSAAPPRR